MAALPSRRPAKDRADVARVSVTATLTLTLSCRGKAGIDRASISPRCQRSVARHSVEIEEAFRHYEADVKATRLTDPTKKMYLEHARHFVRWLNDEFAPGEKTC